VGRVTAVFDDDFDLGACADRPAAGTGEPWADGEDAVPQGAWFSVAGTGDAAALCPEAFAQGGAADGLEPAALLAGGVSDPAVLAIVSDNALLGVVGASRRLMSRAAAMTQRAVAEYARRHREGDRKRASRAGYTEFSPDDLAPELVVNASQAETAMLRHEASERRLPGCSQALWDGKLGEYPMKIIADATMCLDDDGAAEADQILAEAAPGLTPGQLRALAARVVLMIDPDAAEQRRRDAAARARVVAFREDAGTAALSGRDLPPDAVLRSWQRAPAKMLRTGYRPGAGRTSRLQSAVLKCRRPEGLHTVSELYGSSGGYDRGDNGNDTSRRYERSSYPVDTNGQECWAEDAEPMTRGEWADYVRSGEQARGYDADDMWGDTDPDAENYARGLTPEIAWRDQGRSDGPNGWESYLRENPPDRDGTSEPGDMWGDTYPDDAADHAATWDELMGELDHGPAETTDRPPVGDQRPGSLDAQRYPDGVTAVDTDPHYYDGDIQAALAADTRPTRQQAARDDGTGRDGQGDNAKPHADQIDGHDADIYAILHENDHLPEPRTRQQAAREDRQAETAPKVEAPGLTEPSTVADGEAHRSWEDGLDTTPAPDGEGAADTTVIGDRQHGEHPYPAAEHDNGELTSQADTGTSTTDQPTETDDALRQRITDLEAANARLETQNTELGKGMAELESENAELGKTVTGLEAHNSKLESRLERLEHKVEDVIPSDKIANRTNAAQTEGDSREKQRGRAPSSEALLFGATAVGGVLTTAADYVRYLPATYAGVGASVLAAGAAAVAWARKRKES
jgi:flagellin-like hook-associated protein FlgL